MTFIVAGVVGALGVGAGLYESSQSQGISNKALGLSQAQFGEQQQWNTMLQGLIKDPASFLSNPLFTSTLNQGLSAVDRNMAAQGYGGSGNMAAALEQYGQSFASQQLLGQENLIAGLTGLGANPASALGAASNAQGQSAGELSGGMNTAALMAMLMQQQGGSGNLYNEGNNFGLASSMPALASF